MHELRKNNTTKNYHYMTSLKFYRLREYPESYQSYLRKDRACKKKKRDAAAQSMTPSELAEHRMKEIQRVKQYREKKALSNDAQPEPSTSSTPYCSSQARGKAIKRVKQSLPFSP